MRLAAGDDHRARVRLHRLLFVRRQLVAARGPLSDLRARAARVLRSRRARRLHAARRVSRCARHDRRRRAGGGGGAGDWRHGGAAALRHCTLLDAGQRVRGRENHDIWEKLKKSEKIIFFFEKINNFMFSIKMLLNRFFYYFSNFVSVPVLGIRHLIFNAPRCRSSARLGNMKKIENVRKCKQAS